MMKPEIIALLKSDPLQFFGYFDYLLHRYKPYGW